MSPLLITSIALSKRIEKECLREVRMADWELMSTWHPLQGPTEMTEKTDMDKNRALMVLENKKSVLTAYQKVCTNPERQKADGIWLVENWQCLKGLYWQNTKHHSDEALGTSFEQLIRTHIQKSWTSQLHSCPYDSHKVIKTRGFWPLADIQEIIYQQAQAFLRSHTMCVPEQFTFYKTTRKPLNKQGLRRKTGLWVDYLGPMELSTNKNRGTVKPLLAE